MRASTTTDDDATTSAGVTVPRAAGAGPAAPAAGAEETVVRSGSRHRSPEPGEARNGGSRDDRPLTDPS
jgi:hypothetical protein